MREDTKTQDALSHRERVAQQRRVRETRPTITMQQSSKSWGGSPSSGADAPPSPDGRRTTLPLFILSIVVLAFAPTVVFAQQEQTQPEAAQTKTEPAPAAQTDEPKKDEDGKLKSVPGGKALGMSILGNQEAPKALVIVPWKRSELGNALGISTMLDDSKLPIDKEVFMRMLSYYEIRSETPAKSSAAQPTTATQRRK
jgi:hypothetical protein